jgi:hypothetical protein
MACIINASTTSGLVQTADTSGVLQFQNNGVNLPMSGVAPAFSAYQSSAQSALANATFTKIQFQTEDYDTNSNFDNVTNYRFTPTVAGYYQFNAGSACANTSGGLIISLYKNGGESRRGVISASVSGINSDSIVSAQVYMNGTTDYVEIYAYQNSGTTASISANSALTWFNGCLVRGA